jgi:pyruvate-formate lyase-activating enzyme
MKLLFLILGLTLFNFGYCQNQQIAKITKTIEDSEVIYSFKSNYEIPEWKALQLSERLKNRYSELKTISINSSTQIITFSLNEKVNLTDFLNQFIPHFKYKSYEIK